MELKIFDYIEEATKNLEEKTGTYEKASNIICTYLRNIFLAKKDSFSNITSRVKSSNSLKEKILRNSYYKKYSVTELFENLSDTIGIRIECRFIEDEVDIYKSIKKLFNKISSDDLYSSLGSESIKLNLSDKQPQEQKNGVKIYRIDGQYEENGQRVNFELQIKSLVNMFWGEIEHKIIYKNYNLLDDNMITSMLGSIKNSLTMIDNQLSGMCKQMAEANGFSVSNKTLQTEKLMSIFIFDIYSKRMNKNLGFLVDFRKSCEIIMKYIFRTNNAKDLDDYTSVLLKTFSRLNEVSKNKIDFSVEIFFERKPSFNDTFSEIIGEFILKNINNDFQWNLFFRILFEIEIGNNVEDFESFIIFLKSKFYKNPALLLLHSSLKPDEAKQIKEDFINEIAKVMAEVTSINILYNENIDAVNNILKEYVTKLFETTDDYLSWENHKKIYLKIFNIRLLSVFDYEIETDDLKSIVHWVESNQGKFNISKYMPKYNYKINEQKKIKASEAIKLFNFK
ncbi:GTP pyrophosphokinase [Clostridium akagii]|uniref:GTP pyrophosphokinase n=1 Tax=Clostridium akagii TaxID=91623 RepID=UPI00068FA2E7|nr:hypothetical protein [Clostridium akagii]